MISVFCHEGDGFTAISLYLSYSLWSNYLMILQCMPKVSIVTTIYNRQNYLAQTIESILSQSCQDFELILWDDGSTDKSLDICNHYAAQDSRIQVISANHQGRGQAVAQACTLARGVYIGLVDSDDLLAVSAIAETAKYLDQNPKYGMVYTDYLIIAENNSVKGYGHHCQVPYSRERILLEFMTFHFRLLRSNVYKDIGGFDPTFTYAQDYDLCLRLSDTTEIAQIKQPLYYYRHHSSSISGEKRIEQMLFTKRAIENALHRRNMSNTYDLEFQVFSQFYLVKKSNQCINSTRVK
jgi:glycosyltransferase involved in cell wall biosynthesis